MEEIKRVLIGEAAQMVAGNIAVRGLRETLDKGLAIFIPSTNEVIMPGGITKNVGELTEEEIKANPRIADLLRQSRIIGNG